MTASRRREVPAHDEARADRPSERAFAWLETRCLSYGAGLAYWPFAELLRTLAGIQPEDDAESAATGSPSVFAEADAVPFFARLLDRRAATTRSPPGARGIPRGPARSLPTLAPGPAPPSGRRWSRSRTSTGSTPRRSRSSRGARAHLRDAPLDALPGRAAGGGAPWRVIATRDCARRSVALDLLDADGVVGRSSRRLLGGPPPEELAAFVERTAGNPFFVEELSAALQDNGDLAPPDGTWQLAPAGTERVPPTVEGVLAARIDLLPGTQPSVLADRVGDRARGSAAAARRRRRAATRLESARRRARRARRSSTAHRGGRRATVAFHHALVQDVAYSRLLRRRRRELHLRVAEAAEALYGAGDDTIDLLARHLYLGEAGAKAVEYLVRAGRTREGACSRTTRRSCTSGAPRRSRERRADVGRGVPAIVLELADLHELVGDYDRALELYDEVASETGDVRAWSGAPRTASEAGTRRRSRSSTRRSPPRASRHGSDAALARAGLDALGRRARRRRRSTCSTRAWRPPTRDATPVAGQLLFQLARAEKLAGGSRQRSRTAGRRRRSSERDDLRELATALRISGDAYSRSGGSTRRRPRSAAASSSRNVWATRRRSAAVCSTSGSSSTSEASSRRRSCHRRAMEVFERIDHATGRTRRLRQPRVGAGEAGEHEEALRWCERARARARNGHALDRRRHRHDRLDPARGGRVRRGRAARRGGGRALSRDRRRPAGRAVARHRSRGVGAGGRRGAGPRHPATGPQSGRFACLVEAAAAGRAGPLR